MALALQLNLFDNAATSTVVATVGSNASLLVGNSQDYDTTLLGEGAFNLRAIALASSCVTPASDFTISAAGEGYIGFFLQSAGSTTIGIGNDDSYLSVSGTVADVNIGCGGVDDLYINVFPADGQPHYLGVAFKSDGGIDVYIDDSTTPAGSDTRTTDFNIFLLLTSAGAAAVGKRFKYYDAVPNSATRVADAAEGGIGGGFSGITQNRRNLTMGGF